MSAHVQSPRTRAAADVPPSAVPAKTVTGAADTAPSGVGIGVGRSGEQPDPTFEQAMAAFADEVARTWLDEHPEAIAGEARTAA